MREPDYSDPEAKSPITPVFIFAALLILLRIVFSLFPEARLWGLNQAGYFSWGIYFTAACLLLVAAVAWRHRLLTAWTVRFASPHKVTGVRLLLPLLVIGIACIILFSGLAERAHFLGDSRIILNNPEMNLKLRELGEAVLHRAAIDFWNASTPGQVRLIYRFFSVAAGVIFFAFAFWYGRRIADRPVDMPILLLLILVTPFTLLFFGHVENYSLTASALGVMLLAASVSLETGRRSVAPFIAFAIAVLLHLAATVYLPVILLYFLLAYSPPQWRPLLMIHRRSVIVVLVVCFLVGYAAVRTAAPLFWQMALLPPFGDRFTLDSYSLFSLPHVIDFANLLLFMAPGAFALAIHMFVSRQPEAGGPQRTPLQLFVLVAAVTTLFAAFVVEPKLGMARDWDLMSLFLLGMTLPVYALWIGNYSRNAAYVSVSALTLIILLCGFVPWLGLHQSTDQMFAYTENVMMLEPKHSRSGILSLAEYADNNGRDADAARLLRYAKRHYPEREIEEAGGVYLRKGDYFRAIEYFQKAIEENPAWFSPYMSLGMAQLKIGRPVAAKRNLQIADALNPYNPVIQGFLGTALFRTGDTAKAIENWLRSINGDYFVSEPYFNLGYYLVLENLPDSALKFYLRVPDSLYSGEAYYWRAMAHALTHDTVSALNCLRQTIRLSNDSVLVTQAERVMRYLEEGEGTR
jgi:Tfp pilus assembly protein PilF